MFTNNFVFFYNNQVFDCTTTHQKSHDAKREAGTAFHSELVKSATVRDEKGKIVMKLFRKVDGTATRKVK